jgi:3-dehydroquinate synthase
MDPSTLRTLPDRQWRTGMAEVIKYGLIADESMIDILERKTLGDLKKDPRLLSNLIGRSAAIKARVVSRDEREARGLREILNLGHTFGHAIEAGMGYGAWLHGEAVAVGTMMAVELSRDLGWLKPEDVARCERLFQRAALPVSGPALGTGRYLELMQHDKKVQDGILRLVMLQSVGRAVVFGDAKTQQIEAVIARRCPKKG